MSARNAREFAENASLRVALEKVGQTLAEIKSSLAKIADQGGDYGLSEGTVAITIRIRPPVPPLSWPCMPDFPQSWGDLNSVPARELQGAVEDLQRRVDLMRRIVEGRFD